MKHVYAFAIDEKSAFAVVSDDIENEFDDEGFQSDEPPEPKTWHHYFVGVDANLSVTHFKTPGAGVVYSAARNPFTGAIWMLARNRLYLLSRRTGEVFHFALPEDKISVFGLCEIGGRFYLSCSYGRVWYYDLKEEDWFPLIVSEPFPKRQPRKEGESVETYVGRTTPARVAYIKRFPDFQAGFALNDALYFVADFGKVVQVKGKEVSEVHLDSGGSLVRGHAEEDQAVICSFAPVSEIYRGTMEDGFELIFQSDDRALHLTANHEGVRYIGASWDPGTDGPSLFTLEGDELTVVKTGCSREPNNLIELVVKGSVLWAIDKQGLFRLTSDGWSLTEMSDVLDASASS